MNSRDYWARREDEALKHRITDEKEYDREIKRIYSDMLDSVQEQINAFYGKYAAAEGITLAEAKKRVSKADIAEYERKAKRYVRDKDFSKKANEEMRLYNAMMKINRMEMLKANIGLETIAGHTELEKYMAGILKGRTEDELKRQAGILGKTVLNNAAKADAIVNGSFHSGTFSDRIWQYQDLMREDLGRMLQTGLIQGKNPRAVMKDLKKYWFGKDPKTGGGAVYCMERLMRTELARVQTEAQKQSFERNGFDYFEFIANRGCCDICSGLNGKHFKVDKMMPGENAPPMHPHCRCSTAAWTDSKEYEAWLDFLDKGATTAEWERLKENPEKLLTKTSKKSIITREALSRYFNSSDQLFENAKKVPPIDGYEDIFIHGDKSGFAIRDKAGNEVDYYSPREFAEILKADPNYHGGAIRLFACETAADGAVAAQMLANQLNVEILAPSNLVWIDADGNHLIGSKKDAKMGVSTGKWVKIKPKK